MKLSKSCKLLTPASVIVLALFFTNGQCDSTCPNGITNITAFSGNIIYPESGGTYGKNEIKCWSIQVPIGYRGILIRTLGMDLESSVACDRDYVQFSPSYNDLPRAMKDCGRRSYNFLHGYILNVDQNAVMLKRFVYETTVYYRFVSDDTVEYKGFNISFIAVSNEGTRANYLNATEDETIEFSTPKAGIENYPSPYAERWILIVPEGHLVQIDFDIFELKDSWACGLAYVEFREAFIEVGNPTTITGHYGPFLTDRLCGSTKPNSIQSKGNMVWVQFVSGNIPNTAYKGFKASFKAVSTAFIKADNAEPDIPTKPRNRQGGLSVSRPMMHLFLSALIMHISKNNLF